MASSSGTPCYIYDIGGARIRVSGRLRKGRLLHKAHPCDGCHRFFLCNSTYRVLVDETKFKTLCPRCIPLLPSVWLPN